MCIEHFEKFLEKLKIFLKLKSPVGILVGGSKLEAKIAWK